MVSTNNRDIPSQHSIEGGAINVRRGKGQRKGCPYTAEIGHKQSVALAFQFASKRTLSSAPALSFGAMTLHFWTIHNVLGPRIF